MLVTKTTVASYHNNSLVAKWGVTWTTDTKFSYTLQNFFHPFVGELISQLNRHSLAGVMDASWQDSLGQDPLAKNFFTKFYTPTNDRVTEVKVPHKEIDVEIGGPYANYNWELFFHIPFTIAVHLSKSRRFAEAQRWYHYIFDPTSTDTSIAPPLRFWKFLAFRKENDPKQIDELLTLLSKNPADLTGDEPDQRQHILDGYHAILNKPFQPHVVARTRHLAYQYAVVMKYLDNLIAWGDDLFAQDTIESINDATQRYVLAANLLGPKPQRIPTRGEVKPKTYAQLKSSLDAMGNALVDLESQFPFNLAPFESGASGSDPGSSTALFGIGRTLYFCIPRNEKLLGYWDTVADRLFKIRHCMNIQGVVRPLALFDPPIDPGMLVKAAAAGLDISSIVSGLNQPIGPLRCLALIQKASELCSEVKSLGGALLAALEKGDSEHVALARQRHEVQIQQMTQEVRYLQWQSAREATQSLLTSRKSSLERLHYWQRQLGLDPDQNAPDTLPLDRRELTEENFDEAFSALVGQYDKALTLQMLPPIRKAGSNSPAQQSGASGQGRLQLNFNEDAELNVDLPLAHDDRVAAMAADTVAAVLSLIPDMGLDLHFWGLGGNMKVFGGSLLATASRFGSTIKNVNASDKESGGNTSAKTATYERRADDWVLQYNSAAHELMQNGRQILTSLIAEQIAHHEYLNTQQQIKNSDEINQLLHDKFTNEELYLWMQGELSRLYYQYYRFAFDTARKAERTMKRELMRPELDAQDFIKFNYWDGGRKGLLSGEALHYDVKQMEMAYHENNKRELEITRHISLRQLDPIALLSLKTSGACQFTVPEWLFDRDCPGHYMRRIKSVAVSIPSVVGPYTSVNCTVSLLKSSIRKSSIMKDGAYIRQGTEDDRFIDYAGAIQSMVTSAGNNDSGLFETNLRDERFLPFEQAGAESTWKLDLPADNRGFDYATISDVILHLRYTARQGVDQTKVNAFLRDLLKDVTQSKLALLFSLRHDFPTEWSAFVNGGAGTPFSATIRKDFFPFFTQGKDVQISSIELFKNATTHHATGNPATATTDINNPAQQGFTISAPEDPAGPNRVVVRDPTALVFLVVRYSL
jgi:hypothetical protein